MMSGADGARAAAGTHSAPSSMASSGTKTCASGARSAATMPAPSKASTSGLRSGIMFPPPEVSGQSTPLVEARANVLRARGAGARFTARAGESRLHSEAFVAQQVKLRGEQTGLSVREQLHPPDRRGGPRLRPLPGGGDPLSARAERPPAFRAREVDLPQLRPRRRIRRAAA